MPVAADVQPKAFGMGCLVLVRHAFIIAFQNSGVRAERSKTVGFAFDYSHALGNPTYGSMAAWPSARCDIFAYVIYLSEQVSAGNTLFHDWLLPKSSRCSP